MELVICGSREPETLVVGEDRYKPRSISPTSGKSLGSSSPRGKQNGLVRRKLDSAKSKITTATATGHFLRQKGFGSIKVLTALQDEGGEGWQHALSHEVLHPFFRTMMWIGGFNFAKLKDKPGCDKSDVFFVYLCCIRLLFITCIALCGSRLFMPVRPAFYSIYSNTSLLFLHLWLPYAHTAVGNLLQVMPLFFCREVAPD